MRISSDRFDTLRFKDIHLPGSGISLPMTANACRISASP
jgi:hypothetical protein